MKALPPDALILASGATQSRLQNTGVREGARGTALIFG